MVTLTSLMRKTSPTFPNPLQTTSKHKLEGEKAWKHGYESRCVHVIHTTELPVYVQLIAHTVPDTRSAYM